MREKELKEILAISPSLAWTHHFLPKEAVAFLLLLGVGLWLGWFFILLILTAISHKIDLYNQKRESDWVALMFILLGFLSYLLTCFGAESSITLKTYQLLNVPNLF